MISSLQGSIADVNMDGIVQLSCGPVTLELHMPASQAARLHAGESLRVHTHFHFSSSADVMRLYAFTRADERDLFQLLLGGSGVGPRVALSLMDIGFGNLVRAIIDSDEKVLSSASGVGRKLAQKIGVELADKVSARFGSLAAAAAQGEASPRMDSESEQAIDAICALGFTRAQAEDSLSGIESDGADTATLVRRMLAWLSRN